MAAGVVPIVAARKQGDFVSDVFQVAKITAPSELNCVYPGRSSSAENRTDTADDLERTPNPPPAVTVFEPVDVPTLPTTEDSNEAQMENPIVNPTDMLPPYTPISPIDSSYKWGSAEGSAFRLKDHGSTHPPRWSWPGQPPE